MMSALSFILIMNHDFIIYIDFTHIAAWNTSDDVRNYVTRRIFNTDLYFYVHCMVKWTKKYP